MNAFTFKGTYGDYTFSDKQIESNPYLNKREREIMHGLAQSQSSAIQRRKDEFLNPSITRNNSYEYKTDMSKKGRRTLEKRPTDFEFEVDWSKKRWYESKNEFLMRMANRAAENKTVSTKEVKRDNINIERSTFGDGTEVTKWNKETSLFY